MEAGEAQTARVDWGDGDLPVSRRFAEGRLEKAAPRAARPAGVRIDEATCRWHVVRSGRLEPMAEAEGGDAVLTVGIGSRQPWRRAQRASPREGWRGPIDAGRSGRTERCAGDVRPRWWADRAEWV